MCRRGKNDPTLKKRHGTETYRLALRDIFNERLQHGQTYYAPCLGWKEFVPSYFGPFRERDECGQRIEPLRTGEIHIPAMLISMWEHWRYSPSFCKRWIVDGVMSYEHERPTLEVRNAE
jgi:CRISPR-associated protein Cas5d